MEHVGDGCAELMESDVLGGCEAKLRSTQERDVEVFGGTGIDGVGLVDTDDAMSKIGSKNNNTSGNEEMRIDGHEYGHINLPLWTISMVGLVGEGSLESINIPRDVQSDDLSIGQTMRFVRADDVSELLKNIAGLREVAVKRAREARDLITKHRQHMDAILSHRTAELMSLRREMVKYRESQRTTQLAKLGESLHQNWVGTGVKTAESGDGQLQSSLDGNIEELEDRVEKTIPPIHGDEVCKEIDRPRKIRKVRNYRSVSERPPDVIYGSWKMTKSE